MTIEIGVNLQVMLSGEARFIAADNDEKLFELEGVWLPSLADAMQKLNRATRVEFARALLMIGEHRE